MVLRDRQRKKSRVEAGILMWVCWWVVEPLLAGVRNLRGRLLGRREEASITGPAEVQVSGGHQ